VWAADSRQVKQQDECEKGLAVSSEQPYEPISAKAQASDLLRRASRDTAGTLRLPDTEDLSTLAGASDEVTQVLANVAISCAVQVAQLPAAGALSDDSDTHNPAARCAEAADHLHQVAHHLGAANEAARQFHNAISHITIEEEH